MTSRCRPSAACGRTHIRLGLALHVAAVVVGAAGIIGVWAPLVQLAGALLGDGRRREPRRDAAVASRGLADVNGTRG